jgi:hypothetical protein
MRASTGFLPRPVSVVAVPGTPFGVAIVGVSPITSGPATASLVAGVGSILVSLVVGCFAGLGAKAGWGPMVTGAFAVLAGLAALAAIGLGRAGLRQVSRSRSAHASRGIIIGRGLALSGIACGAVGLTLTVLSFLAAVALAS